MNLTISAINLRIFARAINSLAKLPAQEVYFDGSPEGLSLRTLNNTKSAFESFTFSPLFFDSYVIKDTTNNNDDRASQSTSTSTDETSENKCKIPNKAALLIYRTLNALEKTVEVCKIWIDVEKCRLFFQLFCKYGVVRTYSFVLVECDTMQALYNRHECQVKIITPGALMVDAIQTNFKFGQEDINLIVTSRELIMANYVDDEPDPDSCVKTQLRYNADEFEQFSFQEPTEVTFCLKELRAFLSFVEVFKLPISIYFEQAGKPIIFALESDSNFTAELIVATYLIREGDQSTQNIEAAVERDAAADRGRAFRHSARSANGNDYPRRKEPKRLESSNRKKSVISDDRIPASDESSDDTSVDHVSRDDLSRASTAVVRLASDTDTTVIIGSERRENMERDYSPPAKRPARRRALLVEGWSQKTLLSPSLNSSNVDENKIVYAPDSDMEDY